LLLSEQNTILHSFTTARAID